jgi:CRP-like cAMP-binding protein
MNWKERKKQKSFESFEPAVFLKVNRIAGTLATFERGERVFSLGDAASSLLYIKEGSVKLSSSKRSRTGLPISRFGAGDFFGEECLLGLTRRKNTATVTSRAKLLIVRREAFLGALRENSELSHHFIAYLLARNFRIEKCLLDVRRASRRKLLPKAARAVRNLAT